ncbi:hypothetical protein YC2023_002549 [Brassica napus]
MRQQRFVGILSLLYIVAFLAKNKSECLQEEWGVLEKSPEAALDVDQTIFSLLLTGGVRKLEGMEADVVESLIVENHTLVSVFNELMHRERCIIWLNNSVRDLRRRKHESFVILNILPKKAFGQISEDNIVSPFPVIYEAMFKDE